MPRLQKVRKLISTVLILSIVFGILSLDEIAYAINDSRTYPHPLDGHTKPKADFKLDIYRNGELIDTVFAHYEDEPLYNDVFGLPVDKNLPVIYVGDEVVVTDLSEVGAMATRIEKWDFQYREGDSGGFQKRVYTSSITGKRITLDEPGQWVFFLCVKDDDDYSGGGRYYENWSDNGIWYWDENNWRTYFAAARIPVNSLPTNNDKVTLHYVKDTWDGPEVAPSEIKDKLPQGEVQFTYKDIPGYSYAGKYYADWIGDYRYGDTASVYIGGDGIMRHIYFIYSDGGGGSTPGVNARLEIDGPGSLEWTPREYEDDDRKRVYIDLDATASTADKGIDRYEFYIDGKLIEENSTGIVENHRIYVRPSDANAFGQIPITAMVKVYDTEGNVGTAVAYLFIKVEISNTPPNAGFSHTPKPYAALPMNITNTTRDNEDDEAYVTWTIRDLEGDLIFYSQNDLVKGTTDQDYSDYYFESADVNAGGGTLAFKQEGYYDFTIEVWDEQGNYDDYTKRIYVNSEPQPPVADFDMLEYGFPGEPISVTDTSTDPNDDIVTRNWTKPLQASGSLFGSGGTLTFTEEGIYDVSLEVIDYTGLSDSTTKQIQIIPPLPVAVIKAEGTLRQNRLVTLHSRDSLSPRVDPIQVERNEWDIVPLDGQDPSSIKIDDVTDNSERNVVFKEPGRYKVFLRVHNNYSDANPDHEQIDATDTEEIITIAPDEPPVADFEVDYTPPNFIDNPVQATVGIRDTSFSTDGDIVLGHRWVVIRDDNENGNFNDDPVYATFDNITEFNLTVPFEQGNSGAFRAELFVREEFGQPTIERFVSSEERRTAVINKIFEVNWIPDITFDLPEWAYTDDVLDISTVIKDEEVDTTTVQWSLKRAREDNPSVMEDVELDDYTLYSLDKNGGTIQFVESGYYELTATITDEKGQQYSYSREIRVYPLPTAVISDDVSLRWKGMPFNTKENRKYAVNGNDSYAHDYYGPEMHPIDHSKDYWEIVPLNGQNANQVIKIQNGAGGALVNLGDSTKFIARNNPLDETLLFKEKGRYLVRYRVTNTYGKKSPFAEQVITVAEDTCPDIDFQVIPVSYRDADDGKRAELIIYAINSSSNDGDIIALERVRYRFDSDNDGSFDDELWQGPLSIDPVERKAAVKVTHVGKYQIEYMAGEEFGQPTLSEFVTEGDRRESCRYKEIEVDNINPRVDFRVVPENKVDIVFTIGQINSSKIEQINEKIDTYVRTQLEASNTDYIDTTIQALETSTISTDNADASLIFADWKMFEINGREEITSGFAISNNRIYATGGYRPARAFYNPDPQAFNTEDAVIEFTWGLTEFSNDYVHGEAGFIFRMQDKKNYYAYIMDNHSACGNIRYNSREALVRVVNGSFKVIATNSFPSFYRGQREEIRIELKGSSIKVYRNGSLRFDVNDSTYSKGSYGFYVWDQYGAYFSDISITTGTTKTLDEVLLEPEWRENSYRFVVNLSDVELPELNDPEKYPVILSRLMNDDIYFVQLGTDANKSQTESFIADNDGKGTFIYNNNPDMDTALQQLADYILSVVRRQAVPSTRYILINEPVNYEILYTDFEEDGQHNIHRWKYQHDENYFDNSMGKADYNGVWLSDSINQFDKVGKFVVEYRTKDNPVGTDDRFDEYRKWSEMMSGPLELYVHRKPVAQFAVQMSPVESLTENTYQQTDIDFSGEGGKTAEWQPQFDAPAGTTIKTIEFLTPPATDDYWRYSTGNLEVRGYKDGSWHVIKSYYSTYRGTSVAISDTIDVEGQGYTRVKFYFQMYDKAGSCRGSPNGAYYKITVLEEKITGYGLSYTDTSYDIDHQSEPDKGIVRREWYWKEVGEDTWHSGQLASIEPGRDYLIKLRVQDKDGEDGYGAWSDEEIVLLTDTPLPPIAQFSVSPTVLPLDQQLIITDTSYDPNGDTIVEREWKLYKEGNLIGTYIDTSQLRNYNTLGRGTGNYSIQLRVRDETGLWSERYTRNFEMIPVNRAPVAIFAVSPEPLPVDERIVINDSSYDPDGDPIIERQWRLQKPGGEWVALEGIPDTLEDIGIEDGGMYTFALRVKDDPSDRNSLLTPMWSDWCYLTVEVEEALSVTGNTNKSTYRAGEAVIIFADTEGRAFKVEAEMWYPHNEHASTNITELVPDVSLTDPPQDEMSWHTRHTRAEGRDVVVIIPRNTPDGVYPVILRAYKRRADGSITTAEHAITVRVRGTIFDNSFSEIIGPR